MIRSVAKHSYIKGRSGRDRGRKHINYIAYRDGEDNNSAGRKFFDKERDEIDVREVKEAFFEQYDDHGVAMHKLILSPGVQGVDLNVYTRELMNQMGREKGLELEWWATIHENTDHKHAHVVIMGKDKDGHLVRFDRDDYKRLRELGDGYLEREHQLDRFLDRDISDLLKSREYERGGDQEFQRMFERQDPDVLELKDKRQRELDPDRDRREFEQFDKDLKDSVRERTGDLYRVKGSQWTLEQSGRMSEHHYQYTTNAAKQRIMTLAESRPELAEQLTEELTYLHQLADEDRQEQPELSLERMFGGQENEPQRVHDVEHIRTDVMGGKPGFVEGEDRETEERDRGGMDE